MKILKYGCDIDVLTEKTDELVCCRKYNTSMKIKASELIQSFKNIDCSGLYFIGLTFKDISFYDSHFTSCAFDQCKFINCTFAGTFDCKLSDCSFVDCKFKLFIFQHNSKFNSVIFENTSFEDTKIDRPFLDEGEGKMSAYTVNITFKNCKLDIDSFLYPNKFYGVDYYISNDKIKIEN